MKKLIVKGLFVSIFFTLLFFNTSYCWEVMVCEHLNYNPLYFSEAEQIYILAGASRDNNTDIIKVQWKDNQNIDKNETLSNCDAIGCTLHDCKVVGCNKILAYVNSTTIADWQNLDFSFFYNDIFVDRISNTFNILETPEALCDLGKKIIIWKSVQGAVFYIVRIINGTNIDDDIIFESEKITSNHYTFPESTHEMLSNNVVYVEARQTADGTVSGRPINISIYVTKLVPSGDSDGNGKIGLEDAINALKIVSGYNN